VSEAASRRLIDRLVGAEGLGTPRALLATTFDLDRDFVETDFLPSVLRLPTWDDRSGKARQQLEVALAKMEAVVLLSEPRRFAGRPRSLRIHHGLARKPGTGLLHAKLVLLVHEQALRVLITSANLTTAGYRENREVAVALECGPGDLGHAPLVKQLLAELPTRLAPWWTPAARRVHAQATDLLNSWSVRVAASDDRIVWGGGDDPLHRQVMAGWPAGEMVRRIRIVSPFWSEEDGSGPIVQFVRQLRKQGLAGDRVEVQLVTTPPLQAAHLRPVLPRTYGTYDFRAVGIDATAIAASPHIEKEDVDRDDLSRMRRLHAKVVLVEGPKTTLAYYGSANFTGPGWGFVPPHASNLEVGVLVRRRGQARKALDVLVPPLAGDPVALTGTVADCLEVSPNDDDWGEWPPFLRDATLRPPTRDRSVLELALTLDPSWSGGWSVSAAPDTSPLLDEPPGAPAACRVVPLEASALESILRHRNLFVRWPDMRGSEAVAFPVNVSLEARESLPFGEPGSAPTEGDLLAFYQGRVLLEDVFSGVADDNGPTKDPEPLVSAVDTSKILSYQVRGFVEALAGIRRELATVRGGEAALRVALLGPVSPTALGAVVYDEVSKQGRSAIAGAFQLVELSSCVEEAASREMEESVRDAWSKACVEARAKLIGWLDELRRETPSLRRGPFRRYAQTILEPEEEP